MTAGPGPGPLGDEAARLLEALGSWAKGTIGGSGESADGFSDGSPACRLCPLCQLIAVLRSARPETFAHLLEASAAFTAALRSLVEHAEAEARRSGVEHIDLDPPAAGGHREAAPA